MTRDRRHRPRVSPDRTPWPAGCRLRAGQQVVLINLSCQGALLESSARLIPGGATELQLTGPQRIAVAARVDRCRVVSLNPLRYEGALVFERPLHWESTEASHSRPRE
jgi:hypothetical protein